MKPLDPANSRSITAPPERTLRVLPPCVSLDTAGQVQLEGFLRRHRIAWPQVADFKGYSGRLPLQFGVETIPASFLFDRRGRLITRDLSADALARLLSESLGPADAR